MVIHAIGDRSGICGPRLGTSNALEYICFLGQASSQPSLTTAASVKPDGPDYCFLRIAISRPTHALNSSRNAGHRRPTAKFSGPKELGNNSAIGHTATLLSSPLQQITRTLPSSLRGLGDELSA